ncbi:MAG: serine/threonine-protein kinase [Polyangiaceae bacterium]
MTEKPEQAPPRKLDRYAIFDEIAAGGMATVHLGRLLGPVGFSRTVAIKRMHPHLATQADFVSMFLDEARLAARIRHPNVVSILDVVSVPGELALVMEFVQGEGLDRILRVLRDRGERVPPPIAAAIAVGMLHGLHAAHDAVDENAEPLGIVHRDVSPQNVLVGLDGVARVVDFGIAKAQGRVSTTREGQLKGKLMYMSPEQALHEDVDRRTDVFAAGIVLWEMLVGRRLFDGIHEAAILTKVLAGEVKAPSSFDPALDIFDRVVLRALSRRMDERHPSARAMVIELERVTPLATPTDVGIWVEKLVGGTIARRTARMLAVERIPIDQLPNPSVPPPPPPAQQPDLETMVEGRSGRTPPPGPASISADDTTGVLGPSVASQVSSISVSRSHSIPAPPAPKRVWWLTASASALAGGTLAVLLYLWSSGDRPDGPPVSAAGSASTVTSPMPPPSASAAADAPASPLVPVSPDQLPDAPAAASATAAPTTKVAPRRPAGVARPTPSARPTAAPGKPTDFGF